MRHFRLLLSAFVVSAGPAFADLDDLAGRVVASAGEQIFDLPLLSSDLKINVEGDMATVEITQTFENPAQIALEAEYLFPLNQLAAVYGMEMRVGDEVIQAQIREKAKAEAEFKQAAVEGKAAALLTQHRPNMFTQKIANLMPGLPVTVSLRYVQMVPKIDGRHELVVPLIVGPRYESAPIQDDVVHDASPGTWAVSPLPVYPSVAGLDLPDHISPERVSLDMTLIGALAVSKFGSDTHALTITDGDTQHAEFTQGKVLDNRDLVIHYTLGTQTLDAASLSHTDARGGFVSVMIEPPAVPDADTVTPRELVFVLDTSGSMSGDPMNASKRFMETALRGLRPGDYFRIIPFANTARQFSNTSLPATAANVRRARTYVSNLSTGGGTEIDSAIQTAFATQQPNDTLRLVVFLSDGYIGDEASVLRTIHQQIGAARIYAFGVGSSVNRYLLDAMADEGRGYARYVGLDENALDMADALAADLKSPVLTDIEIDWGGLEVTDVTPARLPDLFAGNSLRVYARHTGTGTAQITLKGLARGHAAERPVDLTLTDAETDSALPLIWARNRIADLTRQIAVGENPDRAETEITRLGLDFSLQTRNTSFVAVSQRIVNADGQVATPAGIPLPMVSGVSAAAYPQGFAGSSSPEPHAIIGFLMVAAMTLLGLRRRFA